MSDLYIDRTRTHLEGTGVFIRAKDPDGKWRSVDILTLTKPSLLYWLRSHDMEGSVPSPDAGTKFRERLILMLLGHEP